MKFITRAEWGAAAPTSVTRLSAVNRVFIHYTGMDADEQSDHSNCAARVRGIQRFHMSPTPSDPSKPWADIAYSFIVCKHGYVFEGRGFGVRTAATGSCNGDSLAVCFLGDDTAQRDDVTDAGRKGIVSIVDEIKRRYGKVSVHGHRDCGSTACPGDQLYRWLSNGLPLPKITEYRYILQERIKLRWVTIRESAWKRPGDGRIERLWNGFYGNSKDEVHKRLGKKLRFRRQKRERSA